MKVEGDVYLQMVIDKNVYGHIQGVKVARATQSKPSVTTKGAVVIKLTIEMDSAAFDPLEPEATISIPYNAPRVKVSS